MRRITLIALIAVPWAVLAAIVTTLAWTQEIQAAQWRVQLSSAAEPRPAVLTQQLAEEKKSTRLLGQMVAQKDNDILLLAKKLLEREAQIAEYKKREGEVAQQREGEVAQVRKEAEEYRASVDKWAKEYQAAVRQEAEDYSASVTKSANEYRASVLKETAGLEAAVKKWQQDYEAEVGKWQQDYERSVKALRQNRDEWQRAANEYYQAATYYAGRAGFYASLSSMPRMVICNTVFSGSYASTTCF